MVTVSHQRDQSTPRKSVAHGLRDALARYEAIVRAALDPVVTINAHGIIQEASQSVERVFGWKPRELIGLPLSGPSPPGSGMT